MLIEMMIKIKYPTHGQRVHIQYLITFNQYQFQDSQLHELSSIITNILSLLFVDYNVRSSMISDMMMLIMVGDTDTEELGSSNMSRTLSQVPLLGWAGTLSSLVKIW